MGSSSCAVPVCQSSLPWAGKFSKNVCCVQEAFKAQAGALTMRCCVALIDRFKGDRVRREPTPGGSQQGDKEARRQQGRARQVNCLTDL